MNEQNTHIVKTGLFSKQAFEVLGSVLGQLSDGWGENNPGNDKWWRFASVITEPTGEIVIAISNERSKRDIKWNGNSHWTYNGFNGMNDVDVRRKFAGWVKKTIQMELDDSGVKNGWRRDNEEFETTYLNRTSDISVSDVYFIYDFLMGRDTARKYSIDRHQKIEGEPKSDEDTKKEQAKRDAYDRAEKAYQKERAEIEAWKKSEIEKIECAAEERRLKAFQTLSIFKPL